MHSVPTLLALRLGGQDHALEPGRDYVLGSADDCDLRLTNGVAAHHTRLSVHAQGASVRDLGSLPGTLHNGQPVLDAPLVIGDVLRVGEHEAIVVADDGSAAIVPIPALRAAAKHRKLSAVRVAAASLRRREGLTLAELLAVELRRGPWLAISLAIHVLLFLLLWLWLPPQRQGGAMHASVDIEQPQIAAEVEDTRAAPPAIVSEPADSAFSEVAVEQPMQPDESPTSNVGLEPSRAAFPRANVSLRNSKSPSNGTDGHAVGVGSGEFRRTIGELRKTGLEIVFVFDSTGSMSRTIADTKATIAQMLTVLRYLVPDARFGLVTYRDRGREEYLVRQVPLGPDFWRAANFVQFVSAEGGGDFPEDVRAGLHAAFEQDWQPGARRVVVLAGDAPPHAEDMKSLLNQVRHFTQDGHSFVHTLVTAPKPAAPDTVEAFRQIAGAGRGLCESIDDRDRVLQRVLTFAFGRNFDQDLKSVIDAVETERDRVDVRALDLVRRAGPALRQALLQDPVPQTVWNALVRRPNRAAAQQLVDLLAAKSTPEATRQAVAAALQRIFQLALPPVDPITARELTPTALERLLQLAQRLPE